MRRGAHALLIILAMLATGCGTRSGQGVKQAISEAKKELNTQAYTVRIDGEAADFNGVFTRYFPDQVTARQGDTISFRLPKFNGEPHTVTLGTLVNTAVARLNQMGARTNFADEELTREMLNLPDIFPHNVSQGGPPDANQSAAQPCYLETGVPPLSLTGNAPACPQRSQPDFNGRQTFYNSGALFNEGDAFNVKLSDDIAPGVYQVMCMVHRGDMTAAVTVVPRDQSVPSTAEVERVGSQQLDQLAQRMRPVAQQIRSGTASRAYAGLGLTQGAAGGSQVDHGFLRDNALVAEFGPKELLAVRGQPVTWDVFSFHTISFNAPQDAIGVLTRDRDGVVHLNPKLGAPQQNPSPPLQAQVAPAPAGSVPVTYDGGVWDGRGFKSTGLLASVPPATVSYRVTFTVPGTYTVQCLVHPDMKQTVKVS